MHLLFVKNSLEWPRSSGHDVHTYYMMRALHELGHEISLATFTPVSSEAIAGVDLKHSQCFEESESSEAVLALNWLQEKYRSYWGIESRKINFVRQATENVQPDVVVNVGLEVLPYFALLPSCFKVWYAADEWFWHHFSLVQLSDPKSWSQLKAGLIKGLYERVYRSKFDQAWVVSEKDRKAMKYVAGVKSIAVLPNGVDTNLYAPQDVETIPNSCVFWGRLDFEPNIQALQWFCGKVWPEVLKVQPNAKFQIFGFNPTGEVINLIDGKSILLDADLPDIREAICRHQVAVMPFVSGGGIKNKLLEAAGLSQPILCTERAVNGVEGRSKLPFLIAGSAKSWGQHLVSLWEDDAKRIELGKKGREWVIQNHSWQASAKKAVEEINDAK